MSTPLNNNSVFGFKTAPEIAPNTSSLDRLSPVIVEIAFLIILAPAIGKLVIECQNQRQH